MGKNNWLNWDYFATYIFGWAGITFLIIYCFLWDLHYLTGALGLFFISALTKKAEDWRKEKEAKKIARFCHDLNMACVCPFDAKSMCKRSKEDKNHI